MLLYYYMILHKIIRAGDNMNQLLHNLWGNVHSSANNLVSNIWSLLKQWFSRKNSFTLMVVPHTSAKNIKSVRFPRWAISSFVILNIVMFMIVCSFFVSYRSLNMKLENKKMEYESLQTMKEHDEKQLSEYKANEQQIKEKIQTLKELENKLRGIIDSKSEKPQAGSAETGKLASRGGSGSTVLGFPGDEIDVDASAIEFESLDDMYKTVDNMVKQVDDEINELNLAIKKAEDKAAAMRAIPSVMPVYGKYTSTFGYRKNPFGRGYEYHPALDIACPKGTPVRASGDGVVTHAGWEGGYGNLVQINHRNGYESLYGHNSKIAVKVGQKVKRGDIIAYVGSTGRATGNHCHFEVRLNGKPINPAKLK